MGKWDDYKREERARISAGDYRVSIVSVEEAVSKAGNDMLIIGIQPNGFNMTINHYIVKNKYFNQNMTEFFDSFNIDDGDFNTVTWPGAVGAARLKEDDKGYMKIAWFINQKKAENLPEWVGKMPERQEVIKFEEVEDEGTLPWD